MKKLFISVLMISLVVACKKNSEKPVVKPVDSTEQIKAESANSVHTEADKEVIVKQTNNEILLALKSRDYKKFASYIHPEKGVLFSMYAFINPKEDKHFTKDEFEKYYPGKTIFTWGTQDGSGDLYKETINNYLGKWVFSKDFTVSSFSINKFQGGGNSLNNLKEIYPKHDFTENYIKGTEKNGEMDWKSLRFVFEEFQGKYYLVAVINDQWTI
jgi:hypothetical protein